LQLSTQQNCGLNVEAEMSFAKSKLMDIERRKIDSLRHRFKASIVCEEEKLIVYQLFSRKNDKCPISQLRDGDRIFVTPHDIKTAVEENFRNLFNGQSSNVENSFETVENIQNSLTPNQEDDLLRPITAKRTEENAIFM
jgi:hypothetical protein